jgi:hypothetical protein
LDSDVVAVSSEVDRVFDQFRGSVVFAADMGKLEDFSPFAVNCACMDQTVALKDAQMRYDSEGFKEYQRCTDAISVELAKNRKDLIGRIRSWVNYQFGHLEFYRLSNGYYQHKETGRWYSEGGIDIDATYARIPWISKASGCMWNATDQRYERVDGSDAEVLKCEHLRELLKLDFDVDVPKGWQHWNGGVFLFDTRAESFFADWNGHVLKVFGSAAWRTRDQAALIATVFGHGLQNAPLLDCKFNFIVREDEFEKLLASEEGVLFDGIETQPAFLHFIDWVSGRDAELDKWVCKLAIG